MPKIEELDEEELNLELDFGPEIKDNKDKVHTCNCGEQKMYFGKYKLCPICNIEAIKEISGAELRNNSLVISGIKKLIKPVKKRR